MSSPPHMPLSYLLIKTPPPPPLLSVNHVILLQQFSIILQLVLCITLIESPTNFPLLFRKLQTTILPNTPLLSSHSLVIRQSDLLLMVQYPFRGRFDKSTKIIFTFHSSDVKSRQVTSHEILVTSQVTLVTIIRVYVSLFNVTGQFW